MGTKINAPFQYSRLTYSNLLATSVFIETPAQGSEIYFPFVQYLSFNDSLTNRKNFLKFFFLGI